MKNKSNKATFALLMSGLFFLGIALLMSYFIKDLTPKYSVKNIKDDGCSIYFGALERLEDTKVKSDVPVEYYDYDTLQVVTAKSKFNIYSEEVKTWIKEGGQLVYLVDSVFTEIDYGNLEEENGFITQYSYGKGKIITCPIKYVVNSRIISDRDVAYALFCQIHTLDYELIVFNEYYLFVLPKEEGLWDVIPFDIKLILYQIAIIIGAFFFYKGKRFGKTIPLYEETERSKNEYLYAVANLYRHTKCWDLAIDSYYHYLLDKVSKVDYINKDLCDYWEKLELPHIQKVTEVMEFMKLKDQKHSEKKYIKIITTLEELIEIVDTRSELYWK